MFSEFCFFELPIKRILNKIVIIAYSLTLGSFIKNRGVAEFSLLMLERVIYETPK